MHDNDNNDDADDDNGSYNDIMTMIINVGLSNLGLPPPLRGLTRADSSPSVPGTALGAFKEAALTPFYESARASSSEVCFSEDLCLCLFDSGPPNIYI